MLDKIILGLILEQSSTGYEVKKRIETGVGVFYKASYGALYPTLKKLSQNGFLTTKEKLEGNRQKIFYSITKSGEEAFHSWVSSPMSIGEGMNSHLAKVYFFDKLPKEMRDIQLLQYEENNTQYLCQLKKLEKQFDGFSNKDDFYYKLSTLYYGIYITQKAIKWCKHIREGKSLRLLIKEG